MMCRKISRKLNGKFMDSCAVPASTYNLETLALSEMHQHKLQVCENNWISRTSGVIIGHVLQYRAFITLSVGARVKVCCSM